MSVVAVAAFLSVCGAACADDSDSQVSPGSTEIAEWSIVLIDGQEVTLTGELPNGYPTETYLDGVLLDRDDGGDFGWSDLGSDDPVPEPVSLQATMDCAALLADAEFWQNFALDESLPDDSVIRTLAYSQNAINLSSAKGC